MKNYLIVIGVIVAIALAVFASPILARDDNSDGGCCPVAAGTPVSLPEVTSPPVSEGGAGCCPPDDTVVPAVTVAPVSGGCCGMMK